VLTAYRAPLGSERRGLISVGSPQTLKGAALIIAFLGFIATCAIHICDSTWQSAVEPPQESGLQRPNRSIAMYAQIMVVVVDSEVQGDIARQCPPDIFSMGHPVTWNCGETQ
jgi:hypothetical protein